MVMCMDSKEIVGEAMRLDLIKIQCILVTKGFFFLISKYISLRTRLAGIYLQFQSLGR